jgi:hypothetical protein
MVHVKKTQWFNPISIEILYKPEVVVNLGVSWWIIYIYNGSSFYQIGSYLQVESCYEGWIPYILVVGLLRGRGAGESVIEQFNHF